MEAELFFRVFVALTLASAGFAKVLHPRKLASVVQAYAAFRRPVAFVLGATLAGVEIATGIALLVRGSEGWALASASFLFFGFAAVTVRALRRHTFLDCNCLGTAFRMRHDGLAVGLNSAIAAACAADALQPLSRLTLSAGEGAVGVAVTLSSGTLLVFVYWVFLFARSVVVAGSLQNSRFHA